MGRKSARFYVVLLWQGQDVVLTNQETGKSFGGDIDRRRFTRKRAQEICDALNAKRPNAHKDDYFGPFEIREDGRAYPEVEDGQTDSGAGEE